MDADVFLRHGVESNALLSLLVDARDSHEQCVER